MKKLTSEQVLFARQAMGRWLDMRRNKYPHHPNSADAGHSDLLSILLEGKEPLTDEEYEKLTYTNEYDRRLEYYHAIDKKNVKVPRSRNA